MEIIETIKKHQPDFSKTELAVSNYILKNLDHIETFTITKLADRSGTSTSAVLRFCQSMGFKGYKDFRFELISSLRTMRHLSTDKNYNNSQFFNYYIDSINQLEQLDQELLKNLVVALMSPTTNYIVGVHFSALPAKGLFLGLEDLGIISLYANDYISASHLTNTLKDEDTIVLFSISGSKQNFTNFLSSVTSNMPKNSFLITMNPKAELKTFFTQTIVLPGYSFSNRSVVDIQTIPMMLVEVLLNMIHDKQ
ncbi:MAG: MurR/RpiR family transcriptional regulator [Liquorilactobacillus sp.]|uniref:MurR/RpiR family transcriptional regulator n=1 Tax=Liquorilactobacillus sp. TaxID=2767923 RepID=UPI0039E81F1F